MRLVTLVVAIFLLAPQTRADAAVTGFDSSYAGESAFLNVGPGAGAMFQVFFMNTGATSWRKGTASQVNLTVCLENKVSCNLPSPHADWNDGSWLSGRVYATHFQDQVNPGDIASFAYGIRVPPNAEKGIYRFNGDLALPTGQQLHPEGYYQEALYSFDRFP
jgi:hypothetical protein